MTSQLDRHSETDPKSEMLSAVEAGNRIFCDEINVRGIGHAHICSGDWGRGNMGLGATLPNHIPACRSEF